ESPSVNMDENLNVGTSKSLNANIDLVEEVNLISNEDSQIDSDEYNHASESEDNNHITEDEYNHTNEDKDQFFTVSFEDFIPFYTVKINGVENSHYFGAPYFKIGLVLCLIS
ncbi:30539_t:CDS:2, partial [Racocetra persica]